ncbi:hypothetical protein [Asticcacaulis taihuensis]|jgi:hypothetical protein|uniref:hypothetical protein n=1 Tax=Asticcacaulis taihuensis TaxID=260084 RepID=UPI0026F0D831|nr:hypothetical protein [Asticcacaulis taihuensis]
MGNRKFLVAIAPIAWAFLASSASAQFYLRDFEAPPLSEAEMNAGIAYIESNIKMPDGAYALTDYGRYYAQERGIVYAFYAKPWGGEGWKPGVHVVAYDDLPGVMDGGCDFIDVVYVPSNKAIFAECHGLA